MGKVPLDFFLGPAGACPKPFMFGRASAETSMLAAIVAGFQRLLQMAFAYGFTGDCTVFPGWVSQFPGLQAWEAYVLHKVHRLFLMLHQRLAIFLGPSKQGHPYLPLDITPSKGKNTSNCRTFVFRRHHLSSSFPFAPLSDLHSFFGEGCFPLESTNAVAPF